MSHLNLKLHRLCTCRNKIEKSPFTEATNRARLCKPFKEPSNRFPPGGPVRQPNLSYRPHRLAESIPRNRFLGSLYVYKYGLRMKTTVLPVLDRITNLSVSGFQGASADSCWKGLWCCGGWAAYTKNSRTLLFYSSFQERNLHFQQSLPSLKGQYCITKKSNGELHYIIAWVEQVTNVKFKLA